MTTGSKHWNIDRAWSVTTKAGTERLATGELSRFRAVVMLGAAGAGKTTEAARLATDERVAGGCVKECRLAEFAETSSELRDHLAALAAAAGPGAIIYLDALDEAMVPGRQRWLAIKHWVHDRLRGTNLRVRITCRSAVWPSELTQVLREFAGNESFATAFLEPLADADILAAAAFHKLDGEAFLTRLQGSRARSLADQPLALRMLLRLQKSPHGLPESRVDLFEKGLELLASDSHDRREIDTQIPMSPTELLKTAERLACCTILSGRETVHLGDWAPSNQLSHHDLSDKIPLAELRALGSSGISDSTLPGSFRFAHRQFAEYLAARRLARLPTHQVRALLAGPDGWKRGVAGPLRETAAFTAMLNAEIADWIASTDPEVIGLSDIANSDLRRTATLGVLDRFRRQEFTAAQLHQDQLDFSGLRYEHADADLRPLVTTRADGRGDLLAAAIELARRWKLTSLSADLADLALDSNAPISARVSAGYALRDCGRFHGPPASQAPARRFAGGRPGRAQGCRPAVQLAGP